MLSYGINCVHGILQAIKEKGLNVPGDISMVDLGFSEYTHVYYDPEELGRLAFDRLYQRCFDKNLKTERILMPYKLTVRNSTRKLL